MKVMHNLISVLKMKWPAHSPGLAIYKKQTKKGGGKNWAQELNGVYWKNADIVFAFIKSSVLFASGESHLTFFKGSNNKVFQLSYFFFPTFIEFQLLFFSNIS